MPPDFALNNGATPLMLALEAGNEEKARWFVQAGADVAVRGASGKTALHAALEEGMLDLAAELLDKGANPNEGHRDSLGLPLHQAASQGKEKVVALLLAKGAAGSVNVPCENTLVTPLHAAAQRGKAAICKMLLDAGADPAL